MIGFDDARTGQGIAVAIHHSDMAQLRTTQPLSAEDARELTDRIRRMVGLLWELVTEAHERKAHKALGYATWKDYVAAEFQMSESRSYQLLDQAR